MSTLVEPGTYSIYADVSRNKDTQYIYICTKLCDNVLPKRAPHPSERRTHLLYLLLLFNFSNHNLHSVKLKLFRPLWHRFLLCLGVLQRLHRCGRLLLVGFGVGDEPPGSLCIASSTCPGPPTRSIASDTNRAPLLAIRAFVRRFLRVVFALAASKSLICCLAIMKLCIASWQPFSI
jgi:hypothetical protein